MIELMELTPDHFEFRYDYGVIACIEDLERFLNLADKSPRYLKRGVAACFSEVQAAIVIVRGPEAFVLVSEKEQEKKKESS